MDYLWTIYGRKATKNCSNFAAEIERLKMNLITGTGLAAAYINYKRKKDAYDLAVLKQETLSASILAAINDYDSRKYYNVQQLDRDPNNRITDGIDGLKIVPVLNIGYTIDSKRYRVQTMLVLQNTTDRTINIVPGRAGTTAAYTLFSTFNLYNNPTFGHYGRLSLSIKPRQRVTLNIPLQGLSGGKTHTGDSIHDWMQDLITNKYTDGLFPRTEELDRLCDAFLEKSKYYGNGSKIKDIPAGMQILGVLTADVTIQYNDDVNKDIRKTDFRSCDGVCVWKGNWTSDKDNETPFTYFGVI